MRAILQPVHLRHGARLGHILTPHNFPRCTLRLIRYCIGCNPYQPGCEGRPSPLVGCQASQGFMENFRRQILGCAPIPHPPRDKPVNQLEIGLVQRAKLRRILLRRLHQKTLLRPLSDRLFRRSSGRHRSSECINCREAEKSRLAYSFTHPQENAAPFLALPATFQCLLVAAEPIGPAIWPCADYAPAAFAAATALPRAFDARISTARRSRVGSLVSNAVITR